MEYSIPSSLFSIYFNSLRHPPHFSQIHQVPNPFLPNPTTLPRQRLHRHGQHRHTHRATTIATGRQPHHLPIQATSPTDQTPLPPIFFLSVKTTSTTFIFPKSGKIPLPSSPLHRAVTLPPEGFSSSTLSCCCPPTPPPPCFLHLHLRREKNHCPRPLPAPSTPPPSSSTSATDLLPSSAAIACEDPPISLISGKPPSTAATPPLLQNHSCRPGLPICQKCPRHQQAWPRPPLQLLPWS